MGLNLKETLSFTIKNVSINKSKLHSALFHNLERSESLIKLNRYWSVTLHHQIYLVKYYGIREIKYEMAIDKFNEKYPGINSCVKNIIKKFDQLVLQLGRNKEENTMR